MKRIAFVCALVLVASCGGGSSDQAAQKSDASGGGTAPASQPPAGGVIAHGKLLEFLPTLAGWTQQKPQGSTDTDERVSRVQADYEPSGSDKSSSLGIEIMDTMKNPNILGPLTDFIRANREAKAGAGDVMVTMSPVEVSGFRGMQEWTPGAKNGTLSLLVADRFTVGVTANYISGPEVMRQFVEAIDLKKLAALK